MCRALEFSVRTYRGRIAWLTISLHRQVLDSSPQNAASSLACIVVSFFPGGFQGYSVMEMEFPVILQTRGLGLWMLSGCVPKGLEQHWARVPF